VNRPTHFAKLSKSFPSDTVRATRIELHRTGSTSQKVDEEETYRLVEIRSLPNSRRNVQMQRKVNSALLTPPTTFHQLYSNVHSLLGDQERGCGVHLLLERSESRLIAQRTVHALR